MTPRRRPPTPPRPRVYPVDLLGADASRPSVTGAFWRRPATPAGAMPMDSLPDSLNIERDDDSDAPQAGLL
jgi:hypothetical protein